MARTDDRMEGRRVMTPDEIAADRAVIDAATDGPWTAIGQGVVHDTGACNCGPGGLNGMHEPYCGAGLLADASVDDAAFIAAARTGWPRALDALEAAQEDNDRLGAMVEWLAEVIVDAREACDRTESIQPKGSPDWVKSGIAMRKTVLHEVRKVLNRERNAHPSALDKVTAERDEALAEVEAMRRGEVDGVFTSVVHGCCERAEKAEAAIARVRALCDEAERWALSSPSVSTSRIRAALDRVAPMRAWGIDPGEAE